MTRSMFALLSTVLVAIVSCRADAFLQQPRTPFSTYQHGPNVFARTSRTARCQVVGSPSAGAQMGRKQTWLILNNSQNPDNQQSAGFSLYHHHDEAGGPSKKIQRFSNNNATEPEQSAHCFQSKEKVSILRRVKQRISRFLSHKKLQFSSRRSLRKRLATVAFGIALVFGSIISPSFAAVSGGRVGGGSFKSSHSRTSSPSRTYHRPSTMGGRTTTLPRLPPSGTGRLYAPCYLACSTTFTTGRHSRDPSF